jgi:hypothetical protein
MKQGDHVGITVDGREVGPAEIVEANGDPVRVVVERARHGPYQFCASRKFFVQVAPGRWKIDMPGQTLRQFFPDE